MNSPRDPNRPTNNRLDNPAVDSADSAKAQIEDYLDYLCAPLLGVVPYPQRRRLRLEAADHLYALTEDYAAEGFAPPEAAGLALREYGEPWTVGQSFADAWTGASAAGRLMRFADAATLRAFGWFGVFTVASLLILQTSLLQPGGLYWQPYVTCLAVVSPVIAGVLTGFGLHGRMGLGICRAVAALAAASGVVGLLLLPRLEGLQFALFQLLFWLPVGSLSAAVTAGLARQFRLRHFPRTTR
jgi:hypothetical protein